MKNEACELNDLFLQTIEGRKMIQNENKEKTVMFQAARDVDLLLKEPSVRKVVIV